MDGANSTKAVLTPPIPIQDTITTTTTTSSSNTSLSPPPPKLSKKSPEYVVKSLFAGGIAGCVAKTVIAPLDRVKILFQASNPGYLKYSGTFTGVFYAGYDIYKHHGIQGLFQGHSVTLLRIFPYAAVKFMVYEQYKSFLMPTKESESPLRRLLAGSMAGVTSVFFTYPLDVLRVRMAYEVETKPTVVQAARTLWNEEPMFRIRGAVETSDSLKGRALRMLYGCSNFYTGFSPTVYGMIPYAGISFLTYETMTTWLKAEEKTSYVGPDGRRHVSSWASLIAGGLSGALAQTVSYPWEVIRRNMQVAGTLSHLAMEQLKISTNAAETGTKSISELKANSQYRTSWSTAKVIFAKKGVKGFFVGLSIGYLKVTPMVATSFYVYEYCKRMFKME